MADLRRKGFSLIELMIVVTIIAVLTIIGLWSYQIQLLKGRDSRRKADLHTLERVFEDYYNDHNSYPENVNQVVPAYVNEFPQDPVTLEPYEWSTIDGGVYRIYTKLDWEQDPVIAEVGCGSGCGPGGGTEGGSCDYNYGVSSPNADLESCGECPNGCQGTVCNVLNKEAWNCPQWFCSNNCDGLCSNPAYQCTQNGE